MAVQRFIPSEKLQNSKDIYTGVFISPESFVIKQGGNTLLETSKPSARLLGEPFSLPYYCGV